MGTFTLVTGFGMLAVGLISMAVIGFLGLWIVNKIKDED
jgi:hypothetical protein